MYTKPVDLLHHNQANAYLHVRKHCFPGFKPGQWATASFGTGHVGRVLHNRVKRNLWRSGPSNSLRADSLTRDVTFTTRYRYIRLR